MAPAFQDRALKDPVDLAAEVADLDLGQHDGTAHFGALVHEHAEEQHRLANDGTGHDAAAGDHRVDREATPALLVEDAETPLQRLAEAGLFELQRLGDQRVRGEWNVVPTIRRHVSDCGRRGVLYGKRVSRPRCAGMRAPGQG